MIFCLAAAVLALCPPPNLFGTFVGRDNQLQVRVPRVAASAATATVDGNLDEPAWQQATLLTGFSQFAPHDGIAAVDSTHVLIWYSPTAMYVGVRAFEAHGAVRATLADRDRITADDNVQILLGTFHDRRQAYVFAVNPFGVQMDGTIVESGSLSSGGWTPTLTGRAAPDLSQDFVFTSKGRLTEYGYEVEIRIPFKSIKYQSAESQTWDINVVRQVQHSGYEDSWAPAKRSNASFLGQAGTIEGLAGLDAGLVLDMSPIITQRYSGTQAVGGWTYTNPRPQLGGNVRWGVTNNLTLNGTFNPDFAEVESDASQVVFDPRAALYFADRRPFFLEGIEQFNVPNRLIYTRRIAAPDGALKLTGKVAGTNIGFISASDDRATSPGRDLKPYYNILRAQRDVGRQSRIGMAYTDRVMGGDYNRVANVDGRVVFGGVYTGSFQYAQSYDKTGSLVTNAPLFEGSLSRNGKRYGFRHVVRGIDPDFKPGSGFIARPGLAYGITEHRGTWFNTRGSRIETLSGQISFDHNWQYDNFGHGDAQDKKFHVSTSAGLRGGWALGTGVYWETFGWDKQLFRNYRIERTVGTKVDTIPFTGVGRIPNRDYVFTLNTPQWSRFGANVLYIFGQDENFYEWAQANIQYLSLTANIRPTDQLRVASTLVYQSFQRRTDGSIVGRNAIPRVRAEYQFSRSIFLRLIGEYSISERDDLRDETRTFFPLIINGQKALAQRSATFRGDALFSYQPNPGTVVFLGYGSQANAPPNPIERFDYQPLIRQSDYFFVKFSYLFRM
jgi:hypothetical protein